MAPEKPGLVLPVSDVGAVDLGRLIREIEKLENVLQTAAVRSEGQAAPQLPKLSLLLDQFVEVNKFDLLQVTHRQFAVQFLKEVRTSAPRIHISFSADPSPQFIIKLTTWFRQKISPTVLIAVGLQPGIGAGCVLRTTNKFFDLSLSKSFADSRDLLMKRLRETEVAG